VYQVNSFSFFAASYSAGSPSKAWALPPENDIAATAAARTSMRMIIPLNPP
jgi:hypothetical protein